MIKNAILGHFYIKTLINLVTQLKKKGNKKKHFFKIDDYIIENTQLLSFNVERCEESALRYASLLLLRKRRFPDSNFVLQRTLFQNHLEKYKKYRPKYPTARARGVRGVGIWAIVPNDLKKCPFPEAWFF